MLEAVSFAYGFTFHNAKLCESRDVAKIKTQRIDRKGLFRCRI
jgi:hypothetical protein